jgi:two-component system sensor kinase FixL
LFQTLIATAIDGIVVIDEEGSVRVCNKACERLFGYSEAEVLGQNVDMLMPASAREEHDGFLDRYRRTAEKRVTGASREATGQRKDGTTFPMYLSIGEGTNEGKRIFVGIVSDLTEQHRRDRRIAELQHELLHVVRLTDMGQLASALAHELNQPLTAILNYANASKRMIAAGGAQGERVGDILQKIGEQAARAGDIIRRLRAFVEKREPVRSIEDPIKTINEAISLGMAGAADRNVKLDLSIDPALPHAFIDRIQIQQVMVNLLRNAIEAMEKSPKRLVKVTVRNGKPGFITIAVADTGPGLAPEVARHLFQPFVTTKAKGMGMGLSICRAIVEAHGGELKAVPTEDGARFEFHIPTTEMEPEHAG